MVALGAAATGVRVVLEDLEEVAAVVGMAAVVRGMVVSALVAAKTVVAALTEVARVVG